MFENGEVVGVVFGSKYFSAAVILAAASCILYYVRHTHHTITNPGVRNTKSILGRFLVGHPIQLLVILAAVVGLVAVAMNLLS